MLYCCILYINTPTSKNVCVYYISLLSGQVCVCNIRRQPENLAARNGRRKICLSDYQRISASREAMSSWKTYGGLLTMKSMGPQSRSCLAEPRKEKESQPFLSHSNPSSKLNTKILSRKPSFQTAAHVFGSALLLW